MKTVLQQVFKNWLLSILFYTAFLTAGYLVVCGIWYNDLFSLMGYAIAIIAGLAMGTISYVVFRLKEKATKGQYNQQ